MLDKAGSWFKKSLGYEFSDVGLLQQALTHRSASGASNERLEFLGDAILDIVVSDVIFQTHPEASEGDLSRLRSSLVKDSALSTLATELGLGEHIILGGGERKAGGHRRKSILADALEALFAAVYLDSGFDAARKVIERAYGSRFHEFPELEELRDPKTRLQEWLQGRQLALPEYELVKVSGEQHKRKFEVHCRVDGIGTPTTGSGTTRRIAEQEAASRMLSDLLRGEDQ